MRSNLQVQRVRHQRPHLARCWHLLIAGTLVVLATAMRQSRMCAVCVRAIPMLCTSSSQRNALTRAGPLTITGPERFYSSGGAMVPSATTNGSWRRCGRGEPELPATFRTAVPTVDSLVLIVRGKCRRWNHMFRARLQART